MNLVVAIVVVSVVMYPAFSVIHPMGSDDQNNGRNQ